MTSETLYALTGVALAAMGLAAILLQTHLLRRVIAFNIMGSGVFLILLALAPGQTPDAADPVAQALLLTGIVVAVSATGLALALARRLHRATGSAHLDDSDAAG